jgi:hypothetical protein
MNWTNYKDCPPYCRSLSTVYCQFVMSILLAVYSLTLDFVHAMTSSCVRGLTPICYSTDPNNLSTNHQRRCKRTPHVLHAPRNTSSRDSIIVLRFV